MFDRTTEFRALCRQTGSKGSNGPGSAQTHAIHPVSVQASKARDAFVIARDEVSRFAERTMVQMLANPGGQGAEDSEAATNAILDVRQLIAQGREMVGATDLDPTQSQHFVAVFDILASRLGALSDQLARVQELKSKAAVTHRSLRPETVGLRMRKAKAAQTAASSSAVTVPLPSSRSPIKPSITTIASDPVVLAALDPPMPESTVARIDLEQENALLMETFTSDLDEVHAASNKVTEITRLQAILASKIEEQATQLDAVYANTVEAVENVAQGNEQLRKAIRSSIDFRMGVFLFYLMCSFCLLFLHWYD